MVQDDPIESLQIPRAQFQCSDGNEGTSYANRVFEIWQPALDVFHRLVELGSVRQREIEQTVQNVCSQRKTHEPILSDDLQTSPTEVEHRDILIEIRIHAHVREISLILFRQDLPVEIERSEDPFEQRWSFTKHGRPEGVQSEVGKSRLDPRDHPTRQSESLFFIFDRSQPDFVNFFEDRSLSFLNEQYERIRTEIEHADRKNHPANVHHTEYHTTPRDRENTRASVAEAGVRSR
nr:hypothetical protein [Thermotoga caldifontis]